MFGLRESESAPEPEAPRELAEDLSALFRAEVPVPPEVDRAVVGMARERLARRRRTHLVLRWAEAGALAAASAAAVIVCLSLFLPRAREQARREVAAGPRLAVREDIDRNGRVDILDAFVLARRIEAATTPAENGWDMNGDGVVDRADVDMVAMAAVSLERRTLQ